MLARTWKRLVWSGTSGIESHALRVRVVMANQIAVIAALGISAVCALFYLNGLTQIWVYMSPALMALITVPLVNSLELRKTARMVLTIGLAGCVYIGGSLLGSASQVQLFIYPTMLVPLVLYHQRETLWMWGGMVVCMGVNVLMGFDALLPAPRWNGPAWLLDGQRALSLSGSLALLVYTFWQNHVQLISLVFRNLDKERQRNEMLQRKDDELKAYADTLEARNHERDAALDDLRRSKLQLEDQALALQRSEGELSQLVESLQQKQEALENKAYFDAGMAHMAEVLRWEDSLQPEQWADRVVRTLVRYVGALHGALYVTENEGENAQLWLSAAFGAGELSQMPRRLSLNGSLVGQVGLTRKQLRLSGLQQLAGQIRPLNTAAGALQPADLLITPLVHNDQLLGVLELVDAAEFRTRTLAFVDQLTPALALSLVTLRNQQRIMDLLNQKDQYADQLIEREQLLHKNIEKLVSSHHDLKFTERKLRQTQQELQQNNVLLQGQISRRDAESAAIKARLAELEGDRMQRERMQVVGMAAAKVSGELQQVLGVVKAASDSMSIQLPRLTEGVARLGSGIDQAQRIAFYGMAQRVIAGTERASGAERTRRRNLAKRLAEVKLPDAEESARRLVEAGLDGEIEPYIELLTSSAGPLAIDLITTLAQLRNNIWAVNTSIERERQVLLALDTVLHLPGEPSYVQLPSLVQTALRLLHVDLDGLELITHFDAVPPILVAPLRLQQVLMTVLEQSLRAIKRRGKTHLMVATEGQLVSLQIVNSDIGIAPEQLRKSDGTGLQGTAMEAASDWVRSVGGSLEVEADLRRVRIELRLPSRGEALAELLATPAASAHPAENGQPNSNGRAEKETAEPSPSTAG